MSREHRPNKKVSGQPTPEKVFGDIVRTRRKELGLLQWDLEGDEMVTQAYISLLERGKQQPCLRVIMHLEQKLQFEPGELLRRVWVELEGQT